MYYIYKKPDNRPDVTTHPLPLEIFPGYVLVSESEDQPNTHGMIFDANDNLVPDLYEPEYVTARRFAYPSTTDQMDMLWHAMDRGDMPKVEPFYSEILSVKAKYPKPSN